MLKFTLRIPEDLHKRLTEQATADRPPPTPRCYTCLRPASTPPRPRRRIALAAIRRPPPRYARAGMHPGRKGPGTLPGKKGGSDRRSGRRQRGRRRAGDDVQGAQSGVARRPDRR
ncbi:toxin-antitoxin system HicB family antitoxin [Streptomyces cupreus]|uniref:Toxin-antitoxin system HicB family antitoxin n=1 Tax=Streptomyces cupreus TaxID=2759956 RepID=A0A7X1J5A8_9ACTN|nr:toxin-antitoxin system HicB family antitoxin [Streptomyces cupreus]